MNAKLLFKIIGTILVIEAAFLAIPLVISICMKDGFWVYYLIPMAGSLAIGFPFFRLKTEAKNLFARDGYIVVAIAWIVMSLIGAIPFCISGVIPDYLNAVFESVSGFTTSGISVIADVESVPMSMLFWRSLTHWIGGMGVLVFMLALSPVAGGASMHLMRAEAPGPSTDKVVPKISSTAKFFYLAYLAITLAQTLALVISGLSVFQGFIISFGTVATGGFSYLNSSLAAFTVAQQIIVTVFMVIAGMNFSLFFLVVTGNWRKAAADEELKWYLIILAAVSFVIAVNVITSGSETGSVWYSIHQSVFATVSAMTSTGFAAYDYNLWPWLSKGILILVMFVGGCAGSTAGGIKVSRFVLMFKSVKKYLKEKMHPRSINGVYYNRKEVDEDLTGGVLIYFCIIILIVVFSVVIVSAEPAMDFQTAVGSVSTTLNNNGIEIKNSMVGGFASYHWWSRVIFIIDMLIGRLEIFPIVILIAAIFSPVTNAFKKKKHKI